MAKPRAKWAVILVTCLLTQQFIITTGGPVRARRGALAKKCFSRDEHDLGKFSVNMNKEQIKFNCSK